jgi:hypothetical protein
MGLDRGMDAARFRRLVTRLAQQLSDRRIFASTVSGPCSWWSGRWIHWDRESRVGWFHDLTSFDLALQRCQAASLARLYFRLNVYDRK